MLKIQPIQLKEEQKELCALCSCEYHEESFCYRADEDSLIGICQFHFQNEVGVIENLAYAPSKKDTEAMIIMLRACMNFMMRCGLERSVLLDTSLDDEIKKMSAYREENGVLSIDLQKFYQSPCHYEK